MNSSFLFYCLCFFFFLGASAQPTPNPRAGTINRIENFPSNYVDARNIDIWLPPAYSPNTKYKVLYMHDGQMLYDATTTWNKQEWGVDETLDSLLHLRSITPLIVVGIWNGGALRHAEFTPQKPFESLPKKYQDSLIKEVRRNEQKALYAGPVESDNYLRFITEELKPYIDSNYSTRKDKAHTFIGGSSMGGLISIYALCEYPEIFGGAMCLSTHWPLLFQLDNPFPEMITNYLQNNLPDPESHKLYFDYGTETLDKLYESCQQEVDKVVRKRGYDSDNWKTQKFVGADHSEKSWNERLYIPILFLFGDN